MGHLGWREGPYAPHDATHTHMFATGLLLVVVGGKGYGKANPHFPPSRSSRFFLHPPPCVYTILDGRNHTQKGTGSKNATTHVCVCVRQHNKAVVLLFCLAQSLSNLFFLQFFICWGGKQQHNLPCPVSGVFCFWFISLYSSLSLSLTFFLSTFVHSQKKERLGKPCSFLEIDDAVCLYSE